MTKPPKRATRWPPYEKVPAEWIALGYEIREKAGLPRIDLQLEADNFVDHWIGKSGKDAAKMDWLATWRVWCRRAYQKPNNAVRPLAVSKSHPFDVDPKVVELWAKGIRTQDCGPQTVGRALEKGLLTEAQAKRLGY